MLIWKGLKDHLWDKWFFSSLHFDKVGNGVLGSLQMIWNFFLLIWQEIFSESLTQFMPTAQKMKFSIKDFFSKCDQIRSFLQIWLRLLKKSLMENFIFCAVATGLFLYHQKIENLWLSDVFRNKKRSMPWNELLC